MSALKIPKMIPMLNPPRLTVKKAANARPIYGKKCSATVAQTNRQTLNEQATVAQATRKTVQEQSILYNSCIKKKVTRD